MLVYKSRLIQFAGSGHEELVKQARNEYNKIQKRTPRRAPYVRSKFFKRDKVFIGTFWIHLNQKPVRDRRRRLKLFACAVDLIRNNIIVPSMSLNPNKRNEVLYRFYGQTRDGVNYCVQIKENKKTHRKDFISVFPTRK